MPPYTLWLQGRAHIGAWLNGRGAGCRGSRLLATEASGAPAFGQYRLAADGRGHRAWGLIVLDVRGQGLGGMVTFLDTDGTLLPRFGLPTTLPPR